MAKLHIKTGDTVVVLSGNSKGVKGEVIATSPKEGKVIVQGANMIHKHVKARRQGETGGIIDADEVENDLYLTRGNSRILKICICFHHSIPPLIIYRCWMSWSLRGP